MKYEKNPKEADAEQELTRKHKIIRAAAVLVAASMALFAVSQIEPNTAQHAHDQQIEEQYEHCLDHMLSQKDVAEAHRESFGPFAHDIQDKPQRVVEAIHGCYAYADAVVGPA